VRFGSVPLDEAVGHVLAHGHRVRGRLIPKGTTVGPGEVEELRTLGLTEVVVACLDENDVGEDAAAEALARAAAGSGLRVRPPFTGRCNLVAEAAGVVLVDADRARRANAVDESLTLATLPPWTPTRAGDLVATAKVITLAVPDSTLGRALSALEGAPAVRLAPFVPTEAALILTHGPGTPERLLAKAEESTRHRLEALGSTLAAVRRCAHDVEPLKRLLGEVGAEGYSPVLVLGASAVVDRADVVPRAVEEAGGVVERLGIPVDPGNLLLFARLGSTPVLGIPGCARSPRRNGFDPVLERVLAGETPGPDDFADMAVGGLLAEIPSRPQPREVPGSASREARRPAPVAGLVLAAGRSRRMGRRNKLVADVEGIPMVARVVDVALAAGLAPVVVVTGHGAEEVEGALEGHAVERVHNARADRGMSTSLAVGVSALEDRELHGVLVLLGDMPRVAPSTLRTLMDHLDPERGRSVCVPVHRRRRGNPVLWSTRYLPELARLEGDVGARALLSRFAEEVFEVEVDDPGVLLDVDTPEALRDLSPE
jgi:molybdenum cofactor cytidylyltransferase